MGQTRARAFDAHDADPASGEIGEQRRKGRAVEIEARDVQHHRLSAEEAGRALEPGVDFGQPVSDRGLRAQHEGQEGPSSEPDSACGAGLNRHFGAR